MQDWAIGISRECSVGHRFTKTTYAAWKFVPVKYIICGNDAAAPRSFFEGVTDPARGFLDLEVLMCDEDHSPYLDRSEWIAKVVRKAAGEDVDLEA